jgi:serine/threonine-protein kinase
VTITVSKLKTTVTVPDFTGKSYNEAVDEIYNLGLSIGTVEYKPSDSQDGTVISQTPDANTEVPLETAVNLVLSGDAPD